MIAIGMLRWFFNLQREEIQLLLSARGTGISTGEISNLSEEFLLRFYVLHKRHIPQIKVLFENNGGIVLHLDGTGEAGDEIVFSAKDGLTGITLNAQIMPSESKVYLKPFLQKLKDSYGVPIVVVRDMSKQIRDAVTEIFPNTLQQLCHYHFVNNLGKIIFKKRYKKFRNTIVNTKILAQLVVLKEKVANLSSSDILVKGERKWVALAVEYILWPREIPSDYPFTLPYFEIMNRVVEIQRMIKRIVKWNADNNLAVKAILDISEKLRELRNTDEIKLQYYKTQRIYGWFEKTRKILGVSRHLSENGQKVKPIDINKVKKRLKKTLARIEREGKEIGKGLKSPSKTIRGQFENHWDELFLEVIDKNGKPVKIERNNGIEERSHRWCRMHTRRRTGRSKTTKEMAKYGALLAILANLENKRYVEEVLADVKDFVFEMQNITTQEIYDAKILIKSHSHKMLVRSDKKRVVFLKEFVEILEASKERYNITFDDWLCKISKSNPIMTP